MVLFETIYTFEVGFEVAPERKKTPANITKASLYVGISRV